MSKTISPPPDREMRKPKLKAPPGSWDTHFHVIGPQAIYPLHPDRPTEIEDAPHEALLKLHEALGITRGLLVQSGLHYWDYHHLVHLLSLEKGRWRGVAMLRESVTDTELGLLDQVGVVGLRFFPGVSEPTERHIARAHQIGWSAHLLVRGAEQAKAAAKLLLPTRGSIVIEHSGWQDPTDGLRGEGFQAVLKLVDTGRCWIKLSPRMSNEVSIPFADTLPFIRELIERAPDRMLWGSDWPHPNYFKPMPNDADLLDLLSEWTTDENILRKILVENPASLFDKKR